MNGLGIIDELLAPGGLSTLFQPILEVEPAGTTLFALEALTRGPKNSNLERADLLFDMVRRTGCEVEIDCACAGAAVKAGARFPGTTPISINVHASTLERDNRFVDVLVEACSAAGIQLSRIILEIVEQQPFLQELAFFRALDELRAKGVLIALDDIGIGFSNHKTLIEVRPDLFKIDRFFVRDCKARPHARAAIESIVLLAARLGGRVVAEGIETLNDLETVSSLGIDLVQGFYFARPAASPDTSAWNHLDTTVLPA
jgi:EAL domain-containing protein (putative c-di-GMP-specific phosphodiesterase class I)